MVVNGYGYIKPIIEPSNLAERLEDRAVHALLRRLDLSQRLVSPAPSLRAPLLFQTRPQSDPFGERMGGPSAGEMVSDGVRGIEMGPTAMDLEPAIHPHPTLFETIMDAAGLFYGPSTDIYRSKR